MSHAAARQVRRDIRRAVGEEALGLIDAHTQAIDHQILPNQNAIQERLANVDDRVHALERRFYDRRFDEPVSAATLARDRDCTKRQIAKIIETLQRFNDQGFWGRLRWLVTGR